jgi:phage FluMu protein Com
MQKAAERYETKPVTDTRAENLRAVRCPKCGFYLLDVCGYDHYLVRVKCRKCKFNDVIDTALFRTVRRRDHRRFRPLRRRNTERRSGNNLI